MKAELTYIVTEPYIKLTVRQFFESFYISKKTMYKLMNGHVLLNDQAVKESEILGENDQLKIDFSEVIPQFPKVISYEPITILYEDEHILIVHKEESLLVYDDGNLNDSLTSRVQAHYQKMEYPFPVLPAHRIDEETSGMIIFAKHPLALSYLSHLFESKNIKKVYESIVHGLMPKQKGTINRPIGKDRHDHKMRVNVTGDEAITHYEVISVIEHKTRLKVTIETGRKHQIRVHLAHLGFPIDGDKTYHGKPYSRLLLHFKEVEFIHPFTRKPLRVSDPVPF